MANRLIETYNRWKRAKKVNSQINTDKDAFYDWADSLAVPNLNPSLKLYIPVLKEIASDYNELMYDTSVKSHVKREFVKLMLIKIRDYYFAIILLISTEKYSGVIPIMRSLCETLILLKYIKKNPTYIDTFMKTEGKAMNIFEMKKKVDDKELKEFYSTMSDYTHVNPMSFKLHYLEVGEKRIISLIPFKAGTFSEDMIRWLAAMMAEAYQIVSEIYFEKSI